MTLRHEWKGEEQQRPQGALDHSCEQLGRVQWVLGGEISHFWTSLTPAKAFIPSTCAMSLLYLTHFAVKAFSHLALSDCKMLNEVVAVL